jgi:hypothetical protein
MFPEMGICPPQATADSATVETSTRDNVRKVVFALSIIKALLFHFGFMGRLAILARHPVVSSEARDRQQWNASVRSSAITRDSELFFPRGGKARGMPIELTTEGARFDDCERFSAPGHVQLFEVQGAAVS